MKTETSIQKHIWMHRFFLNKGKEMKKFLLVFILLLTVGKISLYRNLSFEGYIYEINDNEISVILSSDTDALHDGNIYIRENRGDFVATQKDIGRPVVAFLTDPGTPKDVTDDVFTGYWVF